MKKVLKKIFVVIGILIIAVLGLGLFNNSSLSRNAKFSAAGVPEFSPPLVTVTSSVEGFERSKDNDANIIIHTDSFQHVKDNYTGATTTDAKRDKTIKIRDKTKIIESILQAGMKIKFDTTDYDLADGVVDLTLQYSAFDIESEDGKLIAQTKLLSVNAIGRQGFIEFPHMQSIVTVGKNVECMQEDRRVCHPELRFESIIDGKRSFSTLKRGEAFDVTLPDVKKIYLTDAHTYAQYKSDGSPAYMRAEFLIIYDGSESSQIFKESSLSTRMPHVDQYCNITFNESLDNFVTSCGIRSWIQKFFNWVMGFVVNKDETYTVC